MEVDPSCHGQGQMSPQEWQVGWIPAVALSPPPRAKQQDHHTCTCDKLPVYANLIQCNHLYPGILGARGAPNCETAHKYESSSTCVDFDTFHTLNIRFSLISFKH